MSVFDFADRDNPIDAPTSIADLDHSGPISDVTTVGELRRLIASKYRLGDLVPFGCRSQISESAEMLVVPVVGQSFRMLEHDTSARLRGYASAHARVLLAMRHLTLAVLGGDAIAQASQSTEPNSESTAKPSRRQKESV